MPQMRFPAWYAERTARFRPERTVVLFVEEEPRPKRAEDRRRAEGLAEESLPRPRIHGGRLSGWLLNGEDGGCGERESARAADS